MRSLAFIVGLATAFVPAARGAVIVVDAAGTGAYTSLSAAVSAAQSGDVLLVKSGSYFNEFLSPLVDQKSLVIVGIGPSRPRFTDLIVRNLSAVQSVVVRNLEFAPNAGSLSWQFVRVEACQGGVLFEDCSFEGGKGVGGSPFLPSNDGQIALSVTVSSRVVLARCVLQGGRGIDAGGFGMGAFYASGGGPGLVLSSASLVAFDTTFVGGAAGNKNGHPWGPNDGGIGVTANGSTLRLAGCSIDGGAGGTITMNTTNGNGNGGTGLVLSAGSTCEAFDTTFAGGGIAPGAGAFGAVAGIAIDAVSGAVVQHAATARTFALSGPAQPGQAVDVTVFGQTGDVVLLLQGFGVGNLQVGGTIGWLALQPPILSPLVLTTITAQDGDGSFSVPAPPMPSPGTQGLVFLFQPYFVGATQIVAAGPSSFILLQ